MTTLSSLSSPSAQFSVGSLVRARGRDWVVLPDSTAEILRIQPLGGSAEDATGLYLPLEGEGVSSASFALPNPAAVGDARSCRLLREAARLGFRSGAGPFRSFGSIAVEPRPYQLVPLLMALQQEPIRLLIADDVGIGKTVEAGLIAREMWDRGEIKSLAVLCPPHLAQQWVDELRQKFHLEAVPVLSSTALALEKNCNPGESLFNFHPVTVISLDYIKSERRREEFLRDCPDLVIVDEAHTCSQANTGARQQRYQLLRDIAKKQQQHLLLVSATPHSGNADAFRSLLGLLKPAFLHLPENLSGTANEANRRELARHLVQRRRADIEDFSASKTIFPIREDGPEFEIGYSLSPEYRQFFEKILAYARESVQDQSGGHFRRRVRWWAALGLLRALASSPAAASATLKARARNADALTYEEADEIGKRGIFDMDDGSAAAADLAPGALYEEAIDGSAAPEELAKESEHAKKLRALAHQADLLSGAPDRKILVATEHIKTLLEQKYSPIIFCRFIDTAEELKKHLRAKLNGVEIVAVTGLLSPEDRKAAVEDLADKTQEGKRRVLIATDCLSEGINLQAYFDAVVHYDLAWNPTRHEQREGRVDRYGQLSPKVKIITLYGLDNQIDGLVLDVLLRKGHQIRKSLGVSVPVPADTDKLAEAIFEGLLLRGLSNEQLRMFDDVAQQTDTLHRDWDAAAEREKRSRTLFAQHSIKPEEVAREVEAMNQALGSSLQVERFVRESLEAVGQPVTPASTITVNLNALPDPVKEPLITTVPRSAWKTGLRGRFDTANFKSDALLGRTHPLVASLAAYIFESALDDTVQPDAEHGFIGARCGALRTAAVTQRTTLLLLRMRFQIHQKTRRDPERALLAEDCALVGFRGAPEQAAWIDSATAEALLNSVVSNNIGRDQAGGFVSTVVQGFDALQPHLDEVVRQRAAELLESHKRARDAGKMGGKVQVEPRLPADVLGIWVFLPPLPTD